MKTCYMCGISEDKILLQEGVSKEGIVSVCRKCWYKNELPLIETKEPDFDPNKVLTVRERLMQMAGIKRPKEEKPLEKKYSELAEEVDLNKIVEKGVKKELPAEKKVYKDLVDNFHWVVMRKRRMKKLTREEFAREIVEPTVIIEHLEQGFLPKNYFNLIRKIEQFLNIVLFKGGMGVPTVDNFDPSSLAREAKFSSGITISDLKVMDQRAKKDLEREKYEQERAREAGEIIQADEIDLGKIEEIVGRPVEEEVQEEELEESDEREDKKNELSQEDVEDIVFGRK